jgi:hypothetical protein
VVVLALSLFKTIETPKYRQKKKVFFNAGVRAHPSKAARETWCFLDCLLRLSSRQPQSHRKLPELPGLPKSPELKKSFLSNNFG